MKAKLDKKAHCKTLSISLRPWEWQILNEAAERTGMYRSAVVRVLIRQAADARLPIFRKD